MRGTSLAKENLLSARLHTRWGCLAFWTTLNQSVFVCLSEREFKVEPSGKRLISLSMLSVWTGNTFGRVLRNSE